MKSIFRHLCSSNYTSSKIGLNYSSLYKKNLQLTPHLVQPQPHIRSETTTAAAGTGLPNREDLQHGVYEMKDPVSEDQVVNIVICNKDGKEYKVRGKIGDNLLYLAKRFEIEMEGACEASLACTTCHVYVDNDFLDKFEPATEKEEDLLDMAPFLKENSRLGCQIILQKEHRGLKVTLPSATKNFYVDGHKPSHH